MSLAARAIAAVLARALMDGASVRTERPLRARAPVMRGVVLVVKLELIRIRHGHHVHALVPKISTMMLVYQG